MPLAMVKHLWTVDEVLRMEEKGILPPDKRLELIRGELIEMSPIGSQHAAVVDRIQAFFITQFAGRINVRSQGPIQADEYSVPEPDIAVLRFREDFYEEKYPGPGDILLVIEVADSSLGFDRKIKAPLYAEMGIPEYWIVDLKKKCVEQYQQPEAGRYTLKQIRRRGEALVLPGLGVEVEVERVFGVS